MPDHLAVRLAATAVHPEAVRLTVPDGLGPYLVVFVGLLGLVIGSFLNVIAYRVPLGLSLSHPPSRCPTCETPIKPYDNVPVLGWLWLRGRCRSCSAPISPRYPLVEAMTGALFVCTAVRLQDRPAVVPAFLWLVAVTVALLLIGLGVKKLPNRLTYPLLLVGAVLLAGGAYLSGDLGSRWRPSLVGLAVMLGFFGLLWFVPALVLGKSMLGLGDVKLAPSLGLYLGYLGWTSWTVGWLAATFYGGVGAAVLLLLGAGRKARVPYGPYLIAGTWTGVLVGIPVARLWLGPELA